MLVVTLLFMFIVVVVVVAAAVTVMHVGSRVPRLALPLPPTPTQS